MFYGGSISSDRKKWRLINIELDVSATQSIYYETDDPLV